MKKYIIEKWKIKYKKDGVKVEYSGISNKSIKISINPFRKRKK